MRRFVEGIDRGQATLFPECLEDWIDEDNPIRVVDAFVDKLDRLPINLHSRTPTSRRSDQRERTSLPGRSFPLI